MPGNPRVQRMVEEILESGRPAEVVCRDSPELLSQVREGWRKLRTIRAQLGVLFPETDPFEDRGHESPLHHAAYLPQFPGYEVQALLGQGGMGVVFRARQLRLNRLVALKMIPAGACASRDERGRFQQEAEAVAALQHPNIVQIYDIGETDGRPYFTMELLDGGNLDQHLAGVPQPARRAAELLATLAGAVQVAHQGGIVHRDLKPSNVLLTVDSTPKIADFGLARRLEGGAGLTWSGMVIGTPSYMAPEQASGDKAALGPAVDIYALGAILYELLTGRPPFRSETAAETVRQVIDQDPVPPSRLNAKVPRDLETICLKCLHKESMLRYGSAAALAEDLHHFLRGEAIVARPQARLARLARRVRRRPKLSTAIACGSLMTATLVGGWLWLIMERAETARRSETQRVATEWAADEDLREMVRCEEESSWLAAGAALERAKGRLGDRSSAALRERLEQGARDLELVARLDAIRMDRTAVREDTWGLAHTRSAEEIEATFRAAGLGRVNEAPATVAARVKLSKVRRRLVAALDDWAACVARSGREDWPLEVARQADRDSPAWYASARDPASWKDKETLIKVVGDAPVAGASVPLLMTLQLRMDAFGIDPIPFLKRIQMAYPDDFWVNLELGTVLLNKDRASEAIGYLQAAMVIRPKSAIVSLCLGQAMSKARRFEEALDLLRQAVELAPTSDSSRFNFGFLLYSLDRHVEAIDQLRVGLRLAPKSAWFHYGLGACLDATSRHAEADGEYRQATMLDPKLWQAKKGIRDGLIRQARLDEAQLLWEKDVSLDLPDHLVWDGYAELCLFLGRENEYHTASRALILRFEDTQEAAIAERTGRACLLLPVGEAVALQAEALIDRALASENKKKPTWSFRYYLFSKALAEYRLGRLDSSMAILRGEASKVLGPAPHLVLAMAQHRKGREDDARKTLAKAVLLFDWRAARANNREAWIYHVLRREAERMILPDLYAFLEGTHRPRDNDERFALLGACQFANRPDLAAGLYADAFAEAPQLAGDLHSEHRHNAARAAALAGRTEGAMLGEEERTRWRLQAKQWLWADLAVWSKALSLEPAKFRDTFRRSLMKWQGEPDLSGLRDPAELDKLPAYERKECLAFWAEVKLVLDRLAPAK